MENKKVRCPECGATVIPYTVGTTDDHGDWEYDHTECPIGNCGHVFTQEEMK
jgi:hypothetical protein